LEAGIPLDAVSDGSWFGWCLSGNEIGAPASDSMHPPRRCWSLLAKVIEPLLDQPPSNKVKSLLPPRRCWSWLAMVIEQEPLSQPLSSKVKIGV
jgi:hypothetical protein